MALRLVTLSMWVAPSSRKFTSFPRVPLTEMLIVSLLLAYPAVVVPTPVTTPGTMRISVAAFRPLRGNS